ncbi:DUF6221 family protein [Klenkia brasiliensis]|uniref:Uncharacterized protein n=1 Tax=Klenkia brasiliensis TaxID=333142 RepID=A0A1G7MTK2_9ACTN|nr:DUF6221 family protein [Klenkia brasiliensis]SDF64981.1 hypothetical protein SAMN05660324_0775 [Klenkia brasiliensis]
MHITDFVLARVAEDERRAKLGVGQGDEDWAVLIEDGDVIGDVGWSPHRVLRACYATRCLVAAAQQAARRTGPGDDRSDPHDWLLGFRDGTVAALRPIAEQYADHPDFDPIWGA